MTRPAPTLPFAAALVALALAACTAEAPEPPETPAPGAPNVETPVPPGAQTPTPETPSPNTPSPDAPYVGVWAGPQASCDNAPATGEFAPIQITRTNFLGYENRCDIRSVTRTNAGYEAVLRCTSEGTTSSERVLMGVDADALTLTYRDRPGAAATFTRCSN